MSNSIAVVPGTQSGYSKKSSAARSIKTGITGTVAESESDISISPNNEFSNMPTYRVPCKSSRGNDGRAVIGAYIVCVRTEEISAVYLYCRYVSA